MPQDTFLLNAADSTEDSTLQWVIEHNPHPQEAQLTASEADKPKGAPLILMIFAFTMLTLTFWPLVMSAYSSILRWFWVQALFVRNRTREATIAFFLEKNFPYYCQLDAANRQKFARRVYQFQRYRRFHFTNMPPSVDVRYMVAAAAVQLTFGLRNFYLWSFSDIHILPGDYRHILFEGSLEGHITYGNMYFSWSHLQAGYAVPDNMQNVGLHEMAHALAYECFTNGGGDAYFRNSFYRYSAVARPIFNAMQKGQSTMLGYYATHNYDEFWAVSVEAFFEQPEKMSRELPELYTVMCRLLCQDPLAMQHRHNHFH